MENKNTNTSKNKSSRFGIGVFLLCIAVLWFVSFKLFKGGIGGEFLNNNESENTYISESEEIFSSNEDYPVAIVFDNHPDSQLYFMGISEAAVVYEWLAEGGATRFMGIYSGAPSAEKIGPVRSARPYLVEIASGWSAFFWHAGGSPESLDLIKTRTTDVIDLNEISGLGPIYFWRDNDVPRPHNLFTSGELIALGIKDFELDELPYEKLIWQWQNDSRGAPLRVYERAKSATSVYVDFSEGLGFDASYEYDPDAEIYKRFMGGIEHKDHATGAQLTASNIIIQRVPWEGYYPSGLGRIKLDLTGEGEMILFQKGKIMQGTWKKETRDDQTQWLDENGQPIILAKGQTWIEILPGTRVVSFE
ncbi:DUF3048 domain-containing protein [Patescibacteria group bacterium]|nr:DUF3048 domain-containing protein [Patescibacteria group bacterium]